MDCMMNNQSQIRIAGLNVLPFEYCLSFDKLICFSTLEDIAWVAGFETPRFGKSIGLQQFAGDDTDCDC